MLQHGVEWGEHGYLHSFIRSCVKNGLLVRRKRRKRLRQKLKLAYCVHRYMHAHVCVCMCVYKHIYLCNMELAVLPMAALKPEGLDCGAVSWHLVITQKIKYFCNAVESSKPGIQASILKTTINSNTMKQHEIEQTFTPHYKIRVFPYTSFLWINTPFCFPTYTLSSHIGSILIFIFIFLPH